MPLLRAGRPFVSSFAALATTAVLSAAPPFAQAPPADAARTRWPHGARLALSLTFDDGRESQVTVGVPLFARHGARVTFYVVPSAVARRVDGWRTAAKAGHEIGNHSLTHPCSGNFPWSRQKALEDYTLERMRQELEQANREIETLLGVRPRSFAYPCGQTFVGRGREARSYIPLVAELFASGRGWLWEAPPDPGFVDFAQLPGQELDGTEVEDLLPLVEAARKDGGWLVLAGHEIGEGGRQTSRVRTLDRLLTLAMARDSGIWVAPVGDVVAHLRSVRGSPPEP